MIPCGWLPLSENYSTGDFQKLPRALSVTSALRILQVQDIPFPNSKKMGKGLGNTGGLQRGVMCFWAACLIPRMKPGNCTTIPRPKAPNISPASGGPETREGVCGRGREMTWDYNNHQELPSPQCPTFTTPCASPHF